MKQTKIVFFNSKVEFKLMEQDYELFTITKVPNKEDEAVVRTNAVFDRENRTTYNFRIQASDGTNEGE